MNKLEKRVKELKIRDGFKRMPIVLLHNACVVSGKRIVTERHKGETVPIGAVDDYYTRRVGE